jgi:hypothetical protein
LASSVGAAAGVVSTIILAITDIYLSGHGNNGLLREYFTWSAAGVHLSIGDMIMLGTVMFAAAFTWWLYGRDA